MAEMLGHIGHAGGAAQPYGMQQPFGAPQQPAGFGLQQPAGFGYQQPFGGQQPGFGAPAGGLHPFNPLVPLINRANANRSNASWLNPGGATNWNSNWNSTANALWPGSNSSGGWGLGGWGFNTLAGPTAFWGSVNDDLYGGGLGGGGWNGNGGGWGGGGGYGGGGYGGYNNGW